MRPFNLKEYMENPSLKVIIRHGERAWIERTDLNHRIDGKEYMVMFHVDVYGMYPERVEATKDGEAALSIFGRWVDLFFED